MKHLSVLLFLVFVGVGCSNQVYFYESSKFSLGIEGRPDPTAPVSGNLGFKYRVAAVVPSNKLKPNDKGSLRKVIDALYKTHLNCDLKEFGRCFQMELMKEGFESDLPLMKLLAKNTQDKMKEIKSKLESNDITEDKKDEELNKIVSNVENVIELDAVPVRSVFKLHLHDHPTGYNFFQKAITAHRVTISSEFATGKPAVILSTPNPAPDGN